MAYNRLPHRIVSNRKEVSGQAAGSSHASAQCVARPAKSIYEEALLPLFLIALGCYFFLLAPGKASGACAANDLNCDTCISGAVFTDPAFGQTLIDTIFTIINTVIGNAAAMFYSNTVGSADFQLFVAAGVLLYVATYGAMIMFAIIPAKPYDISVRLIKIAVLYSLIGTTTGFTFFIQWIGGPIENMMNQLIILFNNVGTGSNIPTSMVPAGYVGGSVMTTQLDNATMAVIIPAISQIFSIRFITAILSLVSTNAASIASAAVLVWAMKDFVLLLINALFTYVKAIIGLAFLFGIAPVFIIFILFEKTRQAFLGWLKQVLSFALQPVLLFGFLAFYIGLICNALDGIVGNLSTGTLSGVLTNSTTTNGNVTDFCYVKWFSFPGGLWDVYWWRPTDSSGVPVSGDVPAGAGPYIPLFNALYLLVLCHLGYSFCMYIEALAGNLTGGLAVGSTTVESLSRWAGMNNLAGRSIGGVASGAAGATRGAMRWLMRPGGQT